MLEIAIGLVAVVTCKLGKIAMLINYLFKAGLVGVVQPRGAHSTSNYGVIPLMSLFSFRCG